MKAGFVYLMASRRNGTLYCGVTSDLVRRVWEHRNGAIPGFSRKHGVKALVWYEAHDDINEAIRRETQIKGWRRAWKLELIETFNPGWEDLYDAILPGGLIEPPPVIPGGAKRRAGT